MKNIQFSILEKSCLKTLAKFIVQENFSHHNENLYISQTMVRKEVEYVFHEEMNFFDSKIIVAKSNDKIVGAIRTLKWNTKDILPMEKMFSVDIKNFVDINRYNIWHIGRFAIKKGYMERGISLFKILMTFAIQHVCSDERAMAVAECDIKLLKTIRILGIRAHTISDSIHYLGSETVPVILEYESLKNFLERNLHLLTISEQDFLHKSVVISNSTKNYTFV